MFMLQMYTANTCEDIRSEYDDMAKDKELPAGTKENKDNYQQQLLKRAELMRETLRTLIAIKRTHFESGAKIVIANKTYDQPNIPKFNAAIDAIWKAKSALALKNIESEFLRLMPFDGQPMADDIFTECNAKMARIEELQAEIDRNQMQLMLFRPIEMDLTSFGPILPFVIKKELNNVARKQLSVLYVVLPTNEINKSMSQFNADLLSLKAITDHVSGLNELLRKNVARLIRTAAGDLKAAEFCSKPMDEQHISTLRTHVSDAVDELLGTSRATRDAQRGTILLSSYARQSFVVNADANEQELEEIRSMEHSAGLHAECWKHMVQLVARLRDVEKAIRCNAHQVFIYDHNLMTVSRFYAPIGDDSDYDESKLITKCANHYLSSSSSNMPWNGDTTMTQSRNVSCTICSFNHFSYQVNFDSIRITLRTTFVAR